MFERLLLAAAKHCNGQYATTREQSVCTRLGDDGEADSFKIILPRCMFHYKRFTFG